MVEAELVDCEEELLLPLLPDLLELVGVQQSTYSLKWSDEGKSELKREAVNKKSYKWSDH